MTKDLKALEEKEGSKEGTMSLDKQNWFKNLQEFSELVKDENIIAIFLDIASNPTRSYEQLSEDLGLDFGVVAPIISKLELNGLIEKNPGITSRNFKLSFNGLLFLEQLKTLIPEISERIVQTELKLKV